MLTWGEKRKAIYITIASAVALIVIIIPLFFILYQKPTCFDGKKNGDEGGVDCGGSCQLLCSFEVIDPIVVWNRAFRTAPGIYSAVAYIENPNLNSEAVVSYEFKLFNDKNELITTRANKAFIPKNKVFAIFEPNISVGNQASSTPRRVAFSFTEKPAWFRYIPASPDLAVIKKVLSNEEVAPRIDAQIKNNSSAPQNHIEVVALVYDDKENAIGASRTFIDTLSNGQAEDVVFTWPAPFETREEICQLGGVGLGGIGGGASTTPSGPAPEVVGSGPEALGVMLAIDRSGSMESDGTNPPQPLTAVKEAAVSFVNNLDGVDKVGIVSFATEASSPPDALLSTDYAGVKQAVEKISITRDGTTQYTNIGDAIDRAFQNLSSPELNDLSERVIVLLTDGIATKPEKAGEPNYALDYAEQKANEAKAGGALLYVIGLGDEVNAEFLKKIASVPEQYFPASSVAELKNIYKEIAVKICKNQPALIEIIPRVIPANFF